MDPESVKGKTAAPRKVKFAPKAPPRRLPKPEVKTEKAEDDDAAHARDLLRHFNENMMKPKAKVEKKVAGAQVAFGYGGSSNTIRSYGVPKGGSNKYQGSPSSAAGPRIQKEYVEPWDYYSYYPATLPFRRPYSGNPELLDEEEFGEASQRTEYDENTKMPAVELDLLDENQEASFIFLQLPPTLPLTKRSATSEGQDAANSASSSADSSTVQKSCTVDELSGGFMGKMLVYRSGAIKLKLGDTLYDVASGMNCGFAQDVVAINTAEKSCCVVGELSKRAILFPDVNSILNNMVDL